MLVVRHPNQQRGVSSRPCRFWNPATLKGCLKKDGCDFKHDLVPNSVHLAEANKEH